MRSTTPARTPRRALLAVAASTLAVVGVLAALGALVLGSSAGTATAAPARSGFPPERPTRVLAIGDSVMEGAADDLVAALPGREVLVDTEVSRSTAASADAAAAHGTDWDVVVILLAHNDGGSPGVYQPPYRRLLDSFAGVPQVVVLTIHEVRPYYAGVNAFLRAEAAGRPNVRVADWNAVAGSPGATAGDGLHLSGSGARLMADLVADEVASAEQAAVPPPTTLPPTTTAPPTTTTLPPTTTTTTTPPTTTSTSTSTTTTAPPVVEPVALARRSSPPEEPADDDGDAASPGVLVALLAAVAVATTALTTYARRLPT